MVKNYRTVQQWNHWLTQGLGDHLLEAEKVFLTSTLKERYGKHVLLIGVPKQYELLKCSVMSNQVILTSLFSKQTSLKCIESDYQELPIVPSSIDLVILPHLLEWLDNPHQLLIEACRIVKPEGLIMILGFNPMSLWGLKKWWNKNKDIPWTGHFISPKTIKYWLKLADFELIKQDMLLFRPPMMHHKMYEKLKWLEGFGKRFYSPWGGVYVLTAQAKTIPLTPIKLHWKQKLSALHPTVPRPTMRDIHHIIDLGSSA